MELQWPLILFTFFNCLAGGIFLMQGILTLMGLGKKMQLASLISALVALGIGGLSVFMHLQHWERMFNGFGHITSGITIELIFVVLFALALVLYFLMMRRSESGFAPKWCAVVAIVVSIALPIATGDSYLMAALLVWNTPLLPAYYAANTILLGGLAAAIIAAVVKVDDVDAAGKMCMRAAFVGAVVTGVITIIYAVVINGMTDMYTDVQYYFDPTLPDVGMVDVASFTGAILSGSLALPFWLGNVIVGCLVPAIISGLAMAGKLKCEGTKRLGVAVVALICAIVGSFVWRALLYVVAISALPFY